MFIPIPIILFITIIYLTATTKTNSSLAKAISTRLDYFYKQPRQKQLISIAKIMFALIISIVLIFATYRAYNRIYKSMNTAITNSIRTHK